MNLHLVGVDVALAPFVTVLRARGVGFDDDGYLAHMWVESAFGPGSFRPFHAQPVRGCLRLLGYSERPAEALRAHAATYATPEVEQAGVWATLRSKPLPDFPAGVRLGFHARVCATVSEPRSSREVDAWARRKHRGEEVGAEEAWMDWTTDALRRADVQPESVRVRGWRWSRVTRRAQGDGRRAPALDVPDVEVAGVFRAAAPERVEALLRRGLGRHRAFGFGMVRLVPPEC